MKHLPVIKRWDGEKYVEYTSTTVTTTGGSGDSGGTTTVNAIEYDSIVASEALIAGDFVNIWQGTATTYVRKATASVAGKEANGFVLEICAKDATAKVYRNAQVNNECLALTPAAKQYLSIIAGKTTTTPPVKAGQVVQYIGLAKSATEMIFDIGRPVVLSMDNAAGKSQLVQLVDGEQTAFTGTAKGSQPVFNGNSFTMLEAGTAGQLQTISHTGDVAWVDPNFIKGLGTITFSDTEPVGAVNGDIWINKTEDFSSAIVGIPAGGKSGQVLTKLNNTDHNVTWQYPSAGGSGSILTSNAVTNAYLSDVGTSTIKGRVSDGTGDPEDLSAIQVRTLLNVENGANKYIHPVSHPASMVTGDTSNRFVTDSQITSWTAKQAALGFTPANTLDVRLADARTPLAHTQDWSTITGKPTLSDSSWKGIKATQAAVPLTGNTSGDLILVMDNGDTKSAFYACRATTGTFAQQWAKIVC